MNRGTSMGQQDRKSLVFSDQATIFRMIEC